MTFLSQLTAAASPRERADLIQSAIDDCAKNGGGRVSIPAGTLGIHYD